ncbi:PIG-L deacetylase family protein [Baia soyae]|uniref:LmbE family N-acetylglucosaminyl deacetylase n=1 Tax=Baia soyae TaxID=1544746 RepID=A0A4V2SXK4_9BACL|nr:PIG-L family deacetylase [Baia soyae]TCP66516.1 LmbE family N-acetylglucosaminyl deacetylase [Baia soyae]
MSKKARHLVIAPHHDDEILGCGGTMAKAVQNGEHVQVVILTKGDFSGIPGSPDESSALRKQECIEACKVLGVHDVIFLDEPDRSLVYSRRLVEQLVYLIQQFQPTVVYYPHREESDREHQVVNELMKESLLLCQSGFLGEKVDTIRCCLKYEVWTPMKSFQVVNNVTDFMDLKLKSLECYSSQLKLLKLKEGIYGLNSYRGMQTNLLFAEVFGL